MPSVESDATPGPVTVVGVLTSTSGLGAGARLCLAAFHQAKLDTRYGDVSRVFRAQDLPAVKLPGRPAGEGEGGLLVAHVNPHMLPLALGPACGRALGVCRMTGF